MQITPSSRSLIPTIVCLLTCHSGLKISVTISSDLENEQPQLSFDITRLENTASSPPYTDLIITRYFSEFQAAANNSLLSIAMETVVRSVRFIEMCGEKVTSTSVESHSNLPLTWPVT